MDDIRLKPCPFCENKAVVFRTPGRVYVEWVCKATEIIIGDEIEHPGDQTRH